MPSPLVRRRTLAGSETKLLHSSSYADLLDSLRRPAPRVFRLPVLVLTRLVEVWVHHEDLRRGKLIAPRPLDEAQRAQLWAAVRLLVRRATAPPSVGLRLVTDDGRQLQRRGPNPATVTLRGDPGEILLYLMGRRATSAATLHGDTAGIGALENGWQLL